MYETFVRELEVESLSATLKVHQYCVGDVGVVVWDAGIVLGKYLDYCHLRKTLSLKDKKVVDIGAGTGIVGLFAAALGANVILTDLLELVPLLEKNVEENKTLFEGEVCVSALTWGDSLNLDSHPDLILVSDCIYYEKALNDLLKTLMCLSNENTLVLISYEERTSENKEELLIRFLNMLKESFYVEEIPHHEHSPDFQCPDIHLLRCKKHLQEALS